MGHTKRNFVSEVMDEGKLVVDIGQVPKKQREKLNRESKKTPNTIGSLQDGNVVKMRSWQFPKVKYGWAANIEALQDNTFPVTQCV